MDEEMMQESESMEESYPGVEFTPPPGAIPPDVAEGEALIRWTKVGDRYTIIEFEGEPINPTPEQKKEKASMEKEKRQKMSAYEEIDAMAQLGPS